MHSFSWTFLPILVGAGIGLMVPGLKPISVGLVIAVCFVLALFLKDM